MEFIPIFWSSVSLNRPSGPNPVLIYLFIYAGLVKNLLKSAP